MNTICDDSTLNKVMHKRQRGTCRHKGGCSNAAVRGNYNFCAQHRTPKQDVRQESRTSIARALLGSSSNATSHATTTTTTGGAAQHGENNDNIVNNEDDNEDDVIMDEFGDGIPDIIVLDSRGQPEEPATPANDAASSLLNSSDQPVTPTIFGAMAGTVISPDPTPERQSMLDGRSILRGVPAQQPIYTVLPNRSTAGDRSTHLSATGQPSNFAQSIANIGPAQPGNNFMGRLHQASNNRNMVAPTVNSDAQLGNHLPKMVSPAPPPPQQGDSAEPVAPPSLPEVLLRNNI